MASHWRMTVDVAKFNSKLANSTLVTPHAVDFVTLGKASLTPLLDFSRL
jgi:hypothetical protein